MTRPTVIGVLQARMGSSRLPGKVLEPVLGRSVLEWTIRAARASGVLNELIVATTTEATDDALIAECERLSTPVMRGPVDDVLTRFRMVLDAYPGDIMARFTSDCPMLDPAVAATAVGLLISDPTLDCVTTVIPKTLPRGLDAEAIRMSAFERVDQIATEHHRVHVTSYAYLHPEEFRVGGVAYVPNDSDLRITVDTAEDLAVVRAIAEALGDRVLSRHEVIGFLRANPQVVALNAAVEQKQLQQG